VKLFQVHQVIKETNNQLPVGPEDDGSDGDDDGGITFGTNSIPGLFSLNYSKSQVLEKLH
jgi:hypothetical protein